MILRTRGGDVSVRQYDPTIPPPPGSGWLSHAGVGVSLESAFGLGAVTSAVRLVAETVASLPISVYRGRKGRKRELENDWRYELLGRRPSPGVANRFDFYCDLSVSIEGWGNAFVQKVRSGRRVVALIVLDPTRMQVMPTRSGDALTYRYRVGSSSVELSPAELVHFRGFRVPGSFVGLSPVQLHRHELGATIALNEYEGEFFRNGADPGGVLQAPAMDRQKAEEFIAFWRAKHSGSGQRHLPAILYGGMEWKQVGISLKDAQFVEGKKFSVEQIARMWRVPPGLLGAGEWNNTEEESLRFLNFSLLPRLKRIEAELLGDQDLFPPGEGDVYPQFQIDEFLRADAATRAEVRHKDVQSGVLLVDEARAEEGRPPLPNGAGKVPQITPVGGAPNPAPVPAGAANGNGGAADTLAGD